MKAICLRVCTCFTQNKEAETKYWGIQNLRGPKKGEKLNEILKFYLELNWYVKEGGG